jgi:TadE-like protein
LRNTARGALQGASPARQGRDSESPSPRGQTLVEFALILPLLLVVLLGVVDFGRVFTAGITMEAAARNAAEAAAQEYQQIIRNTPTPGPADYQRIHGVALTELCGEAKVLPNRAVDGTGNCTMPITAVCVHDQYRADPVCGQAGSPVPAECGDISGWSAEPPDPSNKMLTHGTPPQTPVPYIEVRTCYQFTTLFNLHLQLPFNWSLNLGDIWMQRSRFFVVGDY